MFSLIEEEHKKNSNEIAKELKRRSYMENNNYDEDYFKDRSYQELPESERYPGIEREDYRFTKSSIDIDKVGDMKFLKNQKIKNPSYRHSYAEPKIRIEKKYHPELLHRTNSSVSNSGRVGIASVHPY